MKGEFFSVTWIFLSYFLIGGTAQLTCSLLTVLCLQECDLISTNKCCRWDSATGNLETTCCPKQLKCPTLPKRYDEPICSIPQCFAMSNGETCDKDLFLAETELHIISGYDQLPVGADSVAECCQINDMNEKNAAECCIVVGGHTKCKSYSETDMCSSTSWE